MDLQAVDELAEDGVLKQFGRALGAAAGAEDVEVLVDLGQAERGVAESRRASG